MLLNSFYGLDSVLAPENIKMSKLPPLNETDTKMLIKKNLVSILRDIHRSSGASKTSLYLVKNEILPFVTTWMDPEGTMLSEISQRERKILYVFTCMWNLKNKTNEYM